MMNNYCGDNDMYPIQTRAWRIKLLPDRGHLYPKAGYWKQCYSSRIAQWCNIEYLGEEI
jgi:hypothetical protein